MKAKIGNTTKRGTMAADELTRELVRDFAAVERARAEYADEVQRKMIPAHRRAYEGTTGMRWRVEELSKIYDISPADIVRKIDAGETVGGVMYHWKRMFPRRSSSRDVYCTNGVVYPSVKDAAEACGVTRSNLVWAMNGRRTHQGYAWSFKSLEDARAMAVEHMMRRAESPPMREGRRVYAADGRSWRTVGEAAEAIGFPSGKMLRQRIVRGRLDGLPQLSFQPIGGAA